MAAEIIHYQMNGLSVRVLKDQFSGHLSELKSRSIGRRGGEIPPRLRLYGAENISRAASFIFVIPPCFPSRLGWGRRADVGMQGDWLLIQTHDRLRGRRPGFVL